MQGTFHHQIQKPAPQKMSITRHCKLHCTVWLTIRKDKSLRVHIGCEGSSSGIIHSPKLSLPFHIMELLNPIHDQKHMGSPRPHSSGISYDHPTPLHHTCKGPKCNDQSDLIMIFRVSIWLTELLDACMPAELGNSRAACFYLSCLHTHVYRLCCKQL